MTDIEYNPSGDGVKTPTSDDLMERLRKLDADAEFDDRTIPLLMRAARRRDASDWSHEDAEQVIAFLLSQLDRTLAQAEENGRLSMPARANNDLARHEANGRRALAEENAALRARCEALEGALEWYGEQARLARLIHREGDAGRHALADDGGKRARAALSHRTPSPEAK